MKLIASDLDGTLFGADSVPEPRTAAAVNAIVEAGYVFAAVTGRSHFGGADRVTSTGAQAHWFIGSNGGHRLNLTTRVLEERLVFTSGLLGELKEVLAAHVDDIGMGYEHEAGFTYDDGFRRHFPKPSTVALGAIRHRGQATTSARSSSAIRPYRRAN